MNEDVKELSDFAELPPERQEKIMNEVIKDAIKLQNDIINNDV